MVINTNEEFITVREAARECGKNPETIRRWIWSGKLPSQKLGNQLFIKKSDLNLFRSRDEEIRKVEDWMIRAKTLREKMKDRGVKPIDSGKLIREMRSERMRELG